MLPKSNTPVSACRSRLSSATSADSDGATPNGRSIDSADTRTCAIEQLHGQAAVEIQALVGIARHRECCR